MNFNFSRSSVRRAAEQHDEMGRIDGTSSTTPTTIYKYANPDYSPRNLAVNKAKEK
jgi:hypothetical protein